MLTRVQQAWNNFLDGLLDAAAACRAQLLPRPQATAKVCETGLDIEIAGTHVGTIGFDGNSDFAEGPKSLAGHTVLIDIPERWAIRRSLPPTTEDALGYLPAFVNHQIERITPWRAADVAYKIATKPLPGENGRIAVDLIVVPTLRLMNALTRLSELGAARILLQVSDGTGFVTFDMAGDAAPQKLAWRRRLTYALALGAVTVTLLAGALAWEANGLADEINDLDQQIASRHAMIARLQIRNAASDVKGSSEAGLPPRVRTLDDLSATLPDDAFLNTLSIRGDKLQISGLARRSSELVPALEQSKHFSEATFSGAITRAESGREDRFQLEMRIVPNGGGTP